jgi:hypothetical protein
MTALEISRIGGWEGRLSCLLREVHIKRFDARTWNCAHFAAAVVVALCGNKDAAQLAELASDAALWDKARSSPEVFAGFVTDVLGAPMANPRDAETGDLALCDTRAEDFPFGLGVCVGPLFLAPGPRGLLARERLYQELSTIPYAWRVG